MASSLIVRGAKAHIVDFGLGVTDLFMRTGVPFRAVESIFLTHHHPDHNIEYGPFLLLGWLRGLPRQLAAYGPPPLAQMTTDYVRALARTTRSEEHTSELQSLMRTPYAVFCLQKKNKLCKY